MTTVHLVAATALVLGVGMRAGAQQSEQRWKAHDPIVLQRDRLLAEGEIGGGEFAHLQQRVAATVEAAFGFAQHSPWPELRELTTDVYA